MLRVKGDTTLEGWVSFPLEVWFLLGLMCLCMIGQRIGLISLRSGCFLKLMSGFESLRMSYLAAMKQLWWWRADRLRAGWELQLLRPSVPTSPLSPPSCSLLLMRELGPNPVFRGLMKAIAYLNHFLVAFNLKRLHFGSGYWGGWAAQNQLAVRGQNQIFLCDVAALKEPILCHVTCD